MVRAAIPQSVRPALTDDIGRQQMTIARDSDQYDQCYLCLSAVSFMDRRVSAVACVCASAQLLCGQCRQPISDSHDNNAMGHPFIEDQTEFRLRRMEAIMGALNR